MCAFVWQWKSLCKAFLVEAKWFSSGKMPNAEEYLENGIVSSGVHVVLIHIFFLLGKGINQQTVNKIDKSPPIISSSATILRLWDDLGSAQVSIHFYGYFWDSYVSVWSQLHAHVWYILYELKKLA